MSCEFHDQKTTFSITSKGSILHLKNKRMYTHIQIHPTASQKIISVICSTDQTRCKRMHKNISWYFSTQTFAHWSQQKYSSVLFCTNCNYTYYGETSILPTYPRENTLSITAVINTLQWETADISGRKWIFLSSWWIAFFFFSFFRNQGLGQNKAELPVMKISHCKRKNQHSYDHVWLQACPPLLAVCYGNSWGSSVNPFTARLAASSFRKRPMRMPNLKLLSLYAPFASAHKRTSIKMHSIESRTIKYTVFWGVFTVYVHFFSPEILQAGAAMGLRSFLCDQIKLGKEKTCSLASHLSLQRSTALTCYVPTQARPNQWPIFLRRKWIMTNVHNWCQ